MAPVKDVRRLSLPPIDERRVDVHSAARLISATQGTFTQSLILQPEEVLLTIKVWRRLVFCNHQLAIFIPLAVILLGVPAPGKVGAPTK